MMSMFKVLYVNMIHSHFQSHSCMQTLLCVGMNYTLGTYHDDHNAAHYDPDSTISYGNQSFSFFIDSKVVAYKSRPPPLAYPSSYKVFYDPALRDVVENIFKRDLILYGYTY